jgi:hypothetical protein
MWPNGLSVMINVLRCCMYVRMYVCTYVCMYVCMYVRMYVCTYVCMYIWSFGTNDWHMFDHVGFWSTTLQKDRSDESTGSKRSKFFKRNFFWQRDLSIEKVFNKKSLLFSSWWWKVEPFDETTLNRGKIGFKNSAKLIQLKSPQTFKSPSLYVHQNLLVCLGKFNLVSLSL